MRVRYRIVHVRVRLVICQASLVGPFQTARMMPASAHMRAPAYKLITDVFDITFHSARAIVRTRMKCSAGASWLACMRARVGAMGYSVL